MARILLVEEAPDLGAYEAGLLESEGHQILRCNGAPASGGACPMLRTGSCAVADSADVIIFACSLFMPLMGRVYTGQRLLRAYRRHPVYGRLPMLVVTLGAPDDLEGTGPLEVLPKFSEPELVLEAVERLSKATFAPQGPPKSHISEGHMALTKIFATLDDVTARKARRQRRGSHATPHI